MGYTHSDPATDGARPETAKILVAGGFGVGKTTLVSAISEIQPLRTEEERVLITLVEHALKTRSSFPAQATKRPARWASSVG